MIRSLKFFALVIALLAPRGEAQTNYNDVLVLINSNSSVSELVGTYFASKRGVPAINVARISVSTDEEIDSTEFNSLRSQVESYLTSNGLTDQMNYIVTTKGMPLKVNRGNTFSTSSPSASVESELALILGPYSNNIGKNGIVFSPYYYQNAPFSRATYGIYLVSRLDGYSYTDVQRIIDRGGPNEFFSASAKFLFDQDPDWNSSLPGLNNQMASAQSILSSKGLNAILDQTTSFLTNQSGVMGYVSWGSNDHYADLYTQNAKPNNTWWAGAIAETYVSTSARSFASPPSYGQSLIADLIAEGITGAKGYVYEPFSFAMAISSVLFDRYTSGYNLAESFTMASRSLSWMDVIIGDPKTSVYTIPGSMPIQLAWFTGQMEGIAAQLKWETVSETNNYGFEIQRKERGQSEFKSLPGVFIPGYGTTLEPHTYSTTDRSVPPGMVYYRLKQIDLDGTVEYQGPIEIFNPFNRSNPDYSGGNSVYLAHNYPNPFNPTTTIEFSLPMQDYVTLKVYNTIGQEVLSLVDGAREEGVHRVTLDGSALPSGLYFYQLRTTDFRGTHRMLLLK